MALADGRLGPHDVASGPPHLCLDGDARVPLPDQGDRRHAYWERQVHACVVVLAQKQLLSVDELRRGIEAMEPHAYHAASYYERWACSLASLMLERGVFSNAELDQKLGSPDEPEPAQELQAGAVVRVRRASHGTRWRKPHLRTPGFVHGVCGVVERFVGRFENPEKLAFGGTTTSRLPLYVVRFDLGAVCDFPAATGNGAGAMPDDAVTCEIYHSWLEPATEAELVAQRAAGRDHRRPGAEAAHPDCKRRRREEPTRGGGHAGGHDDGAGHVHEERWAVEQRAAESEIPCPVIARALIAVLSDKGILGAEEMRLAIEKVDAGQTDRGALGRRVVARAWTDDAFRRRLLQDGNAACAEIGIQASNAHASTKLAVVEQTPEEHHLIVCTLCSCYPLGMLGLSPDWYKSAEYRSRAVREPRAVLAEFGTSVPRGRRVVVHDATADCRYLVLPMRPQGTEGWSESQLEKLVTRDAMIGVTALPAISS